jgi:mono/diheme cytochrome c family protein
MTLDRAVLVGSLFIVIYAAPSMLVAEQEGPPGEALYRRYCSACHGPGAKGDGLVAPLMMPRPSDLTAIAKRNNGEFASDQVAKTIDGRTTLRAHGDPDMPVWGEVLDEEAAEAGEPPATVRQKVQLITEYLKSIQTK